MLTFRFFCLINLFIVSYSIFILFCVHVTVERNTGGQGALHRRYQEGVQVQAVWMDVNYGKEVRWTAERAIIRGTHQGSPLD